MWPESQAKNFSIMKMKRAVEVKQKPFFITFKGFQTWDCAFNNKDTEQCLVLPLLTWNIYYTLFYS